MQKYILHVSLAALVLFNLVNCGSDPSSPNIDAPVVAAHCVGTPSQTVTSNPRGIVGVATVTCDSPATLDVETCIQTVASDTTIKTLLCQTGEQSAVRMLTVTANIGCALDRALNYRTKINVSAGGQKIVTDGFSAVALCP